MVMRYLLLLAKFVLLIILVGASLLPAFAFLVLDRCLIGHEREEPEFMIDFF